MLKNVTSTIIYREHTDSFKGQGDVTSKHNWGQTLKMVVAKIDKVCPNCDHSTRDDFGLRLGYENGKIFGGLCFNCGWRF